LTRTASGWIASSKATLKIKRLGAKYFVSRLVFIQVPLNRSELSVPRLSKPFVF